MSSRRSRCRPTAPSVGELNKQRDKDVKLKLYSRYWVQEYWIVNWQLKTLEIHRATRLSFT
ncbi:Uma2 family endonuclease [Nodosilinea nodulosa]|uniref:Uma2 family endonuclease n=1 Tax=Nodosilinea nodulosa TaxID=416001 RepID=UPI001CEC3CFE|nr:Uma2 family endonuclease [Nodosilinea nodulosa]